MQAGTLTELITILKHQVTVSDYGDQSDQYVPDYTTRANVIWKSGNRTDSTNESYYTYHKTMIVRSYVPVTEYDRIDYKDHVYRILSINKDRIKNHKVIEVELVND